MSPNRNLKKKQKNGQLKKIFEAINRTSKE